MNILLVQHNGTLGGVNSNTRSGAFEPLALEYLASSAELLGHNVRVELIGSDIDEFRDLLSSVKPDVVGFSVYSYAMEDSVALSQIVKKEYGNHGKRPITIFGGAHPTTCPEEIVRHESVDFVVIGEGEETFCCLLEAIENNWDYNDVEGIAFVQKGKCIITPRRKRIENPDFLPYPKREERHLSQSKQYKIVYPPPSQQRSVASVLYSRGCPFSCSFCASESIWSKRVFWRDPEEVCNELEELIRLHGTNLVFFSDLTFNANKGKVLEFCRVLASRDLPLHWWGMFRLDLVDEEMLDSLVEAKCMKLSFGIESPIESRARRIKDHYDPNEMRQREILGYANELGLVLRAFLIIGFPDDTEKSILTYPQHMHDLGVDEIRLGFATPFPGTRFFEEAKQSGLLPDKIDWRTMTTETPYLEHPTLSKQNLLKLQKEIILKFFMSERYSKHVNDKTTRFPKLKQPWIEYLEFLNSKGVFRGRETDYTVLIEVLVKNNSEQKTGSFWHRP